MGEMADYYLEQGLINEMEFDGQQDPTEEDYREMKLKYKGKKQNGN